MDLLTTAQLLGNFGEFIGAIAVVATLVYLAIQVRHSREATEANTKQLHSNSLQSMTGRLHARSLLLGTDPVAAELNYRMMHDPDSLSEVEKVQVQHLIAAVVADLEEAYRQVGLGTLPEAAMNSRAELLKSILPSPAVQEAWMAVRHFPDPAFQKWAETQFAEAPQA